MGGELRHEVGKLSVCGHDNGHNQSDIHDS